MRGFASSPNHGPENGYSHLLAVAPLVKIARHRTSDKASEKKYCLCFTVVGSVELLQQEADVGNLLLGCGVEAQCALVGPPSSVLILAKIKHWVCGTGQTPE